MFYGTKGPLFGSASPFEASQLYEELPAFPASWVQSQVSSLCEHAGNPVSVLQAGMIRTDSDEYFIEPLERGAQELEDHGRVHVVYRRSALLKPPSDISVDYQLQGRTMIVMGSGSSPPGVITGTPTVAMCVMTLHTAATQKLKPVNICDCYENGSLQPPLYWLTRYFTKQSNGLRNRNGLALNVSKTLFPCCCSSLCTYTPVAIIIVTVRPLQFLLRWQLRV